MQNPVAPKITQPDWARRPSGEEVARFYPEHAQRMELEGRAVISCDVAISGDLEDCRLLEETPAGAGFGQAALKIAPSFQMKPMTVDGTPIAGGVVQIPLTFRLPQREPDRDLLPMIIVIAILVAALIAIATFVWRARGKRDPVSGLPAWLLQTRQFEEMIGMLEARFEAADGGYLYRPSPGGSAYWVTGAAREQALRRITRGFFAVTWGGGLAMIVVILAAMALEPRLPRVSPDAAMWIGIALMTAGVLLAFFFVWRFAFGELTQSSPVRGPLPKDEARKIRLKQLKWSRLGWAAVAAGIMLWQASLWTDIRVGYGRLWIAAAITLWLGIALQGFRKWRSEKA